MRIAVRVCECVWWMHGLELCMRGFDVGAEAAGRLEVSSYAGVAAPARSRRADRSAAT